VGDLKVLFTEDGRQIDWKFICELEKLKSTEELHLANKIYKEYLCAIF
jgi:hypothetical protein